MTSDRVYKYRNQVNIQFPVNTLPLAPQIRTINGKEIHFSICGEPDISIPLEKKLRGDYPGVKWKTKRNYGANQVPLSDEEIETADGLVQGVAW
ncbi:MAG: hypothetical protein QF432_00210 [Dehalococcoidales bacterium]|jgi:hypothetical protein|nr:hypothetical protein [Dehalococcoidales bacterium]